MHKKPNQKATAIHSIVGVLIMALFQFLPINIPHVTPAGMQVLGIFLGTLYLWTFVSGVWTSLFCVLALGLSSYSTMGTVLTSLLGNSMLMLLWFILVLAGAMVKYDLMKYVARFFLGRKITQGRPWLFVFVLSVGCIFIGTFISPFASIFLFWPVLYGVFKEVGYTREDKMAKFMLVMVVAATLLGFPLAPYKSNPLVLINNYKSLTADLSTGSIVINNAYFLLFGLIFAVVMLAVILVVAKFLLRIDSSKLKNFDVSLLTKNPLPPLDFQQKVIAIGFVAVIILMMVPSMIPIKTGIFGYLASLSDGIPMLVVTILAAIPYKENKLLDFPTVMKEQFSFETYFMCAAAILLGSALTSEATGISAFLGATLGPIFGGMSLFTFTVVLLVLGGILTNFCNSIVVAMIFVNIIATITKTGAFEPLATIPVVTLVIMFTHQCALFTPAGSPFAAVLHSNKQWLTNKDLYGYTAFIILVETILVVAVGIPLANLMAGWF